MQEDLRLELETTLREARSKWAHRLEAIQADRRRRSGALDADLEEQAVQLQNNETLDELDARGRQELQAIDAALDRIADGSYGGCVRCGEPISDGRLRTVPTAIDCISCAEPRESGGV